MTQEITVNLRISIDPTKIPESLEIAIAILEGISETSDWKKILASFKAQDTINVNNLRRAIYFLSCLHSDYYKWLAEISGEETNLSRD